MKEEIIEIKQFSAHEGWFSKFKEFNGYNFINYCEYINTNNSSDYLLLIKNTIHSNKTEKICSFSDLTALTI